MVELEKQKKTEPTSINVAKSSLSSEFCVSTGYTFSTEKTSKAVSFKERKSEPDPNHKELPKSTVKLQKQP